jgi:Lrp/AsnC family leucine-responsive transcriptional regulator
LRLDAVDVRVLEMIQRDSKPSTTEIARVLGVPVTTVYSKIRRLEKEGIIQGYRAVLDGKKLGRPVVAFILASVSYGAQRYYMDRLVARQVSKFTEVQEVHLVSGPWDFIIKLRSSDVEAAGRFLAEKLRTVKGIDRTETCLVFETAKETTELELPQADKPM